jgi:hypothetical protein
MVFWPIHSLLVWIEGIWRFFLMLPVISQGRVKFEFGSFGAVGECAIHAYATSTARNAFFLTS